MAKETRNIKDSVFVDLFFNCSDAKKNSLSLFNAITGNNFTDPDILKMMRIENTIYRDFQNDVSFFVGDQFFVFEEHQSTINMNMPLRDLLYCGRIFEKITDENDRYKKNLIQLPTPVFYVFYNGEDDIPDEMELKLSDAFKNGKGDLELIVHVYNINEGHNPDLFQKCPKLAEYTRFMATVRRYRKDGRSYKEAIEECIKNGILKEYLEINGSEVVNMLIATYDYETDVKVQREEAAAEALKKGLNEGRKEGQKEGRLLSLLSFLSNGGSETDAKRLLNASDEDIMEAKKMRNK